MHPGASESPDRKAQEKMANTNIYIYIYIYIYFGVCHFPYYCYDILD